MDYKYKETRANSDDTFNYDIIGEFPVKFIDFFKWVLENTNFSRIEFCATNERYGGWLGNKLEVSKFQDKCYWETQKPEWLFEAIANDNIVKCWANGGWGQMTYFYTLEEA